MSFCPNRCSSSFPNRTLPALSPPAIALSTAYITSASLVHWPSCSSHSSITHPLPQPRERTPGDTLCGRTNQRSYFAPDDSGLLRILDENEWRGIGITQSLGWEHFEVHGESSWLFERATLTSEAPEPHIRQFPCLHSPLFPHSRIVWDELMSASNCGDALMEMPTPCN